MFSDGLVILKEWGLAKRAYLRGCVGSRLVGRPRKRWIETAHDLLKKDASMVGKQRQWCMIRVDRRAL